jgi:hypothetical protein
MAEKSKAECNELQCKILDIKELVKQLDEED